MYKRNAKRQHYYLENEKQNILYWRVAIFGVCLHCCLGESWPPAHQTVVNICYQHIQPIVLIAQVKTKTT